MMMRTVFSLSLLILPVSMTAAADNVAIKSDADLAALVRTHGFVNPTLVQSADEATVGEAVAAQDVAAQDVAAQPAAEAPVGEAVVESPVPMAENAMPASEGEVVYEAPVRHHHHYSAPQRRSSRGGLFSELIELERRKNAWLKRTFFGR
jgi:hypothetical protein